MRFDLWEFMFHVIRVHGANLFSGWSAENFDDLYQLIDARFAREQWLAEHEFCHDTARRPNIFYLLVRHMPSWSGELDLPILVV
jgi:hypothetical protein